MSLFNSFNINEKQKYFLIFGGGGIRGIAYCGAYKALEEKNIEVTGLAGSSIGAVFASLIAVGYSYDEVYEMLCATGIDLFKDINIDFKKNPALSKGNVFYDWIKEKIEKKYYSNNYKKGENEPVLFKDLNKDLVIYSVDLTNLKYKEFSNIETPNFEIAKAVRASVSMPGLFRPLEIDKNLIVDGDLLKSMPLWKVSNYICSIKDRIIEFRLEDNQAAKKPKNAIEYVNRVYNAISGFATDNIIENYSKKDKFEYIKINTPDVSVVDFMISKAKRKKLYELGYSETKNYFENYYPKKKNMLFQKYNNLLGQLLKLQKEFKKTNLIKSYPCLCQMFLFLCEEKEYIDDIIYANIIEFKNLYLRNYQNKTFFLFKKAKIEFEIKEELNKKLSKIIENVGLKVKGN